MGKYRIETDNGTYEIETDDVPQNLAAPATMDRPKVPGLDGPKPPPVGPTEQASQDFGKQHPYIATAASMMPGIGPAISAATDPRNEAGRGALKSAVRSGYEVTRNAGPLGIIGHGVAEATGLGDKIRANTEPSNERQRAGGMAETAAEFGQPAAAIGKLVMGTRAGQAVAAGVKAATPALATKIPYVGPVLETGAQAATEAWKMGGPKPPPLPIAPRPTGLTGVEGLRSGPNPPVLPANIASPTGLPVAPGPIRPPLRPLPAFDTGITTPRMPFGPTAAPSPQPIGTFSPSAAGPLAPVKPLNIAGPMPPPAEGAIMPKVEPAQPAPRLLNRDTVAIPRKDAETLVNKLGSRKSYTEVEDRVQKSQWKKNQKDLEEFRAREAKRK